MIARDDAPVVETEAGKVIGYIRNGINTFKGIPYAETTAGANRFMPPVKPKPWTGVRSSRQFGFVAPQALRSGWANDEEAFMFSWDDGVQGEDCLRINLWTPGINDGKKRPVMVWLHGGGFEAGSGQELKSYDGENLARRGDVVVVSLNHRLNVLGYLNLAQFGDRYAPSANAGMLDIVAALEWVRDNIAGFGGDPKTVTIFGQSGGGGKVSVLMGMPVRGGSISSRHRRKRLDASCGYGGKITRTRRVGRGRTWTEPIEHPTDPDLALRQSAAGKHQSHAEHNLPGLPARIPPASAEWRKYWDLRPSWMEKYYPHIHSTPKPPRYRLMCR